jgi:hypothetical protein
MHMLITFTATEYGCAIPSLFGASHVEKGNMYSLLIDS